MSKESIYIERFKDLALETSLAFGVPASIVMAQSILESGWGESDLAKNYNNYFGIKCHGNTNCIDLGSGTLWRYYLKPKYSFHDYGIFLNENSIYESCFDTNDYKDWANCLQNQGYAGSSTTYANKLIKIIEDYQLENLDDIVENKITNFKRRPIYALVLLSGLVWGVARSRES